MGARRQRIRVVSAASVTGQKYEGMGMGMWIYIQPYLYEGYTVYYSTYTYLHSTTSSTTRMHTVRIHVLRVRLYIRIHVLVCIPWYYRYKYLYYA